MKTFLWLAGWVFILLLLILAITSYAVNQSWRHLEEYRTALENRGEIFDIHRLSPPAAPEEGNGAKDFLATGRELQQAAKNENFQPTQMVGETSPGGNVVQHLAPNASRSQKEVPWDEVRQQVTLFEPMLTRIHHAADSPFLEIHSDYSKGFHMELVGVTETLKTSQILGLQGLLFLREGNASGAVRNVSAILRLTEMIQRQPVLISQLSAAVQITTAQALTWEILQSLKTTEQDLSHLQEDWRRVRPPDLSLDLRMERYSGLLFFESATAADYTGALTFSAFGSPPHASWPEPFRSWINLAGFSIWGNLYRHTDARRFLACYQALIDNVPPNPSNGPWIPFLEKAKSLQSELSDSGQEHLFSRAMMPSLELSFSRIFAAQAAARLSQTAIALQQHRLSRGRYPAALQELTPAWLPEVPSDPFDALPLRYRRLDGDAYLLYSIGPDGKDDGGDGNNRNGKRPSKFLDAKDLIWPRAAPTP